MYTMSDSDDEYEGLAAEYFYDIVGRSREPEEILSQIRDGRYYRFLRTHRLKGHQLTQEEMDKALDREVLDWDELHLQYMHSICDNRATGVKSAPMKSHDQVDTYMKLSNELVKAHPDFIAVASRHKKNEWQALVVMLCHEYQLIFNNDLIRGGTGDLPTRVRDILQGSWEPVDEEHEKTIYYIVGAVMRMIDGMAKRSKLSLSGAFKDIRTNSATTRDEARIDSLPSGKVEEKEVVELCYANQASTIT